MNLKPCITCLLILLVLLIFLPVRPVFGETQEPTSIVHAVLLYSPSCPHCHSVIEEDLPPLREEFDDQLQIILINAQSPEGNEMFKEIVLKFELPREKQGVPLLVVGEQVLIGGNEIPERFPVLIREGLQRGGIPWPEIPGLLEMLEAASRTATASVLTATPSLTYTPGSPSPTLKKTETPQKTPFQTGTKSPPTTPNDLPFTPSPQGTPVGTIYGENQNPQSSFMDRAFAKVQRDLVGNVFSIIIFIAMVASLVSVGVDLFYAPTHKMSWPDWLIPVLSLAGVCVAGYLSYIEITDTAAICGPVGDCNTVQQSPYAKIGGVFPVGVFGLIGFLSIAGVWLVYRWGPEQYQTWAAYVLGLLTGFGTLFSAYLTFLEPFVIGATCAWCLTSSLIITTQLWISTALVNDARLS
ncbi:MAG: vitamin K epoxide reductase family protein [Anaerolineales bacterium]